MKKKLLTTFLTLAMCASTAVGVTSLVASASEQSSTATEQTTPSYVVNSVTGNEQGFVSDAEWEAAESYALTGASAAQVSVKFASVGKNFFFRMTANDTTKFSGKDRLAFKISVGGTTLVDLQGNFDPWLTGQQAAGGTQVQSDFNNASNADNTVPYVFTYGITLGDAFVNGYAVDVVMGYNDSTTADVAWGAGEAANFSGRLYLGEKIAHDCADANNNHICDTCNVVLSTCADSETDNDHLCDVCGAVLSECADGDSNGFCDVCGATTHTCVDENSDHNCDICTKKLTDCEDTDANHTCNTCGATISDCVDGDGDGSCDICGATVAKAPENVDLGVVITDLANMPTAGDWAKATSYNLIANNGSIEGATGTIKIYSAGKGNVYFRLEVTDPTTHTNADGLYVYIGTEEYHLETRGNYENWLSEKANSFNAKTPALMNQSTTAATPKDYVAGTYVFEYGWYIPELYEVGSSFRLCVKHRDARSASEGWADGDYAHTIYFDQMITWGEEVDLTVRPETATEGFTGGTENVSYNKANITWNEVTGASTYKLYVYTVNAEGSAEPYTHTAIEGAFYAGEGSYSETILGLAAETAYAVQVIAYDENETIISASELVKFNTISRQEALEPTTPDEGDNGNENDNNGNNGNAGDTENKDEDKKEEKDEGCGSSLAATGLGLGLAVLGAAIVAKKKRK